MVTNKYTPFNHALVLTIEDETGTPVQVSTLTDIKVAIMVNRDTKLLFQKIASGNWLAWTAGDDAYSIKCFVTSEQSNGWQGLVSAEIETIAADNSTYTLEDALFIAVKSALTTCISPAANPIIFTTAFSCDGEQNLIFECTVTAPAGSYIIQYQELGEWKRLYDGYLVKADGTAQVYTSTVNMLHQIAAGNYYIRVLNELTGDASEVLPIYLPDCSEGKKPRRWMNGMWWMLWSNYGFE